MMYKPRIILEPAHKGSTIIERDRINLILDKAGARGPEGPQGEIGPQGPKGDGLNYADMTPEEIASITGPPGEDATIDNASVIGAIGYTPLDELKFTKEEILALGIAEDMGDQIIQSATEPSGIVEGRLWLDLSASDSSILPPTQNVKIKQGTSFTTEELRPGEIGLLYEDVSL